MENQKSKIKNQNYNVFQTAFGRTKFKIFTFYIVILIFTFYILHLYPLSTIKAVESSPSADIKVKLEELKKEIASKAAKLKHEVDRKLKDKAYVGKVKSKSDQSITLATNTEPKIISINQDTVFESKIKRKTKFSQKTLAEEDYIAGLGDVDETGVLTAKKIILLPEAKSETPKAFLWGQVISISDELITLKDREFKNVAVSLPRGSKVKLNDFVILTGSKGKNDIFDTGFVYIIPQRGIIKPKKISTPSAETTKSATPKPTSR